MLYRLVIARSGASILLATIALNPPQVDETADVGLDNQTPVAENIGVGRDQTRFTGKIREVTIEVK